MRTRSPSFVRSLQRLICASDRSACCVCAGRPAVQPHRTSVWEVSHPAAATLDVWRTVHLLQVGVFPVTLFSSDHSSACYKLHRPKLPRSVNVRHSSETLFNI